MEPQELPAYPLASSTTFGSTKREILLVLKREGQSDLQSLAEHLHISKMAVHKHIQELEDQGMIQRVTLRGAKGRPRHGLQLAPKASSLFPKAYVGVTCAALAYIEEKLGREARVFQVRDSRTQLSHHRHRRKLLGSMHSRE